MYRAARALAVLTGFLLVWVIGAVGLIGYEGDPFDVWFLGVLVIGIVGGWVTGQNGLQKATVMWVVAISHMAVVILALVMGKQSVEVSSVGEIVISNLVFIVLWIGCALLFKKAADGMRSSFE